MLVDELGDVSLDTFGLASGLQTVRWMAPELVLDATSGATKESDIYAFGMTAFVRAHSKTFSNP